MLAPTPLLTRQTPSETSGRGPVWLQRFGTGPPKWLAVTIGVWTMPDFPSFFV